MPRVPKLCRHKAANRAYVTDPLTKKEDYLGLPAGSWGPNPERCVVPETLAAYAAFCHALAARRQGTGGADVDPDGLSVNELLVAHARWARSYYVKRGRPTSEANTIAQAYPFVSAACPALPAAEFGPKDLKAVRAAMLAHVSPRTGRPLARKHVNSQVRRVAGVFRWGVENSLVPAAVLAGLYAVKGLARGRTQAPEGEPVGTVPFDVVEATLPRLKPLWQALVKFHLFTGCRADEAVQARPRDFDRSAEPWKYTPDSHKTEHHDRGRVIPVGPQARAAIAGLLEVTPAAGWLFPSRGRGRQLGRGPGHVTVSGYRQAVADACASLPERPACRGRAYRPAREAVPLWTPLEARHSWLTFVRDKRGLEAAQKVAGHASPNMTLVYADADWRVAAEANETFG